MTVLTRWAGVGHELAEGARWTGGRLIWTDILAGTLHEAGPGGAVRTLARLGVPLGAVAPVAGAPGHWIAAAGTGIALLSPDGELTWLDRPEDRRAGLTRMNDGCCDPAGRFWAGSMTYEGTPGGGALYVTGPDGTVRQVLDGLAIPNGPAFSPDGSIMYLADTPARIIYRAGVDPVTGEPGGLTPFAEVAELDGTPDGMTTDVEGRLWVALWGGWAVRCYNTDGTVHQTVPVPAPQPSSVCLGGPDNSRLYVTTARYRLAQAGPESGAVLSGRASTMGIPATPWAGSVRGSSADAIPV